MAFQKVFVSDGKFPNEIRLRVEKNQLVLDVKADRPDGAEHYNIIIRLDLDSAKVFLATLEDEIKSFR